MVTWNSALPADASIGDATHVEDHNKLRANVVEIRTAVDGIVIVDASSTAKGIVELATTTEATTGTDTVRAVTPAGLAAALAASTSGTTVLRWNSTSRVWPARPSGAPFGVVYLSTNDATAVAPTDRIAGDIWEVHPDAQL